MALDLLLREAEVVAIRIVTQILLQFILARHHGLAELRQWHQDQEAFRGHELSYVLLRQEFQLLLREFKKRFIIVIE